MAATKNGRPRLWGWGKAMLAASWVGVGALAFYCGRSGVGSQATAAPPSAQPVVRAQEPASLPAPAPAPSSEYTNQVVAYIYGTTPITREDLGEYLIVRQGAEKLDLLINKKIIDHACQQRGIEVTAAEIDAALAEDLKGLNVDRKQFVNNILKQYHKTLYEWKEDVIRPKLLMGKLCKDRVSVSDKDLHDGFEAYYGEKVKCKIILWPKNDDPKLPMRLYGEIRDSEEKFEQIARKQANPTLASKGGLLDPFGRHTTGNEEFEKVAFSLEPGEVSQLIETPEGVVVIKCIERIPANSTKTLAEVREWMEKEILNKKVQLEIPQVFKQLKEEANPKKVMHTPQTEEELERNVLQEIKEGGESVKKMVGPTQGN
jgi:parvulin-like peptidyl-prolyl isomerase